MPSALTEPVALLLLPATLAFAVVRPRGLPEAVVAIPAERISVLSDQAAAELLAAAEAQLGRPARRQIRSGRLVVARDGDCHRLGPASLGPATRFVVDHAPCPVLLVWPEETPRSTPSHRHPRTPQRRDHLHPWPSRAGRPVRPSTGLHPPGQVVLVRTAVTATVA